MTNGRTLGGNCSKTEPQSSVAKCISPFFLQHIFYLMFWRASSLDSPSGPVMSWWQVFKLITEGEWLVRIGFWKQTKPAMFMWLFGNFFGRFKVRYHRENRYGSGVCPKKKPCHLVTAIWQWLLRSFSVMGLWFRAALCFIQRGEQPWMQYFTSESERGVFIQWREED